MGRQSENCVDRGKTRVTKARLVLGFAYDWTREWCKFCGPIITLDSHL